MGNTTGMTSFVCDHASVKWILSIVLKLQLFEKVHRNYLCQRVNQWTLGSDNNVALTFSLKRHKFGIKKKKVI